MSNPSPYGAVQQQSDLGKTIAITRGQVGVVWPVGEIRSLRGFLCIVFDSCYLDFNLFLALHDILLGKTRLTVVAGVL